MQWKKKKKKIFLSKETSEKLRGSDYRYLRSLDKWVRICRKYLVDRIADELRRKNLVVLVADVAEELVFWRADSAEWLVEMRADSAEEKFEFFK